MRKLLAHLQLLPGRAIVRRKAGHWWGDVVHPPGCYTNTRVGFVPEHIEATFQKGKTHYAVVLVRNLHKMSRR